MEYKKIDYVNKPVSRIFLGTGSAPFSTGENGNDLLDSVYAMGVNAIDTARVYGDSEKVIGKWLTERNLREQIVLLSKCAHPDFSVSRFRSSEADIRSDLKESLSYLNTDYIDIYLLHRDDPNTPIGNVVETMNALHEEGKIKAFGGSNFTHTRLEEANEYAYAHNLIPFTISSPNFGLAVQVADPFGGNCISISGDKDACDWYQKNQMPVICYSSLCRGFFSGKFTSREPQKAASVLDIYAQKGFISDANLIRLSRCEELAQKKNCSVSQIAMSWIYHQNLNTFAIVSTSSSYRMKANIEAISLPLSEAELDYLSNV